MKACFTASSASAWASRSRISGESVNSTSMLSVKGFSAVVSTVMFNVSKRFAGTLDRICFLAVSSAILHSVSSCSGVSSGRPISSTFPPGLRRKTRLGGLRLELSLAGVLFEALSSVCGGVLPVSLGRWRGCLGVLYARLGRLSLSLFLFLQEGSR